MLEKEYSSSPVMKIETEGFEVVAENYTAALQWMESLGIKIQPGRTAQYNRTMQLWKELYKTASADQAMKGFGAFASAAFEIHDFIRIYRSLKDVDHSLLGPVIEKLQRAVTGPVDAIQETPASTAARNFLFEATMSAVLHCPSLGMHSIFDGRSDAGVVFRGRTLWAECKRVTSVDALEKNVRKASSQLEVTLAGNFKKDERGIVALDVSKILNRGDKIYVAANDIQLQTSVDRLMDDFLREHSRIWQSVYQRRDKRVIGTVVRFAFMATSEARNLMVYAAQWGINPRLGMSAADLQLMKDFACALHTAGTLSFVSPSSAAMINTQLSI